MEFLKSRYIVPFQQLSFFLKGSAAFFWLLFTFLLFKDAVSNKSPMMFMGTFLFSFVLLIMTLEMVIMFELRGVGQFDYKGNTAKANRDKILGKIAVRAILWWGITSLLWDTFFK